MATPPTLPFSTNRSTTIPWRKCRFGVCSNVARISCAIQRAIRLCSRGLNRRSSGAIQQAKLNSGAIGDPAHDPAERVYLAHQMSFGYAANRGIAGHLADQIQVQSDQRCSGAQAVRQRSSFATGVAAANHNHIKFSSKTHHYLPMQKVLKISPGYPPLSFHR